MTDMPKRTPIPADPPAWSESDLRHDPHATEDKAERVRAMFTAIARRYDLNNRLHSFGRDQAWRRRVVRLAELRPGDRILDVACGTGDLTAAFVKEGRRVGVREVIGTDFTPAMLDLARAKAERVETPHESQAAPILRYESGDAMDLNYDDASFDVLSIAFGIRNVADPMQALREFRRVLAPGGRLLILEFSTPRNPFVRFGNRIYCHHIMPWTATLIARDRSGAYRYLPRSVDTFMEPDAIRTALTQVGFTDITLTPMTFGVCTCYRAVVPMDVTPEQTPPG